MRYFAWVLLLTCSLSLPAKADNRAATTPVIIDPSAPPSAVRSGGTNNGPLVILVGDAAKQHQAAIAKALRHKRKARAHSVNLNIGAH